jgi:ribonuclease HII
MQAETGLICGVDEAGRGPLAGAVYAAAVILDPRHPIAGLRDSKKLSERNRVRLAAEIRTHALAWSVAFATVEEIEQLNILHASMLAMQRAVLGLNPAAEYALIDGNRCPQLPIPARAIVKGDDSEACISAASILAKTERDKVMRHLPIDTRNMVLSGMPVIRYRNICKHSNSTAPARNTERLRAGEKASEKALIQ